MLRDNVISFFRSAGQVFGGLGGIWSPSGATEGVAPFRSAGTQAGVVVEASNAMQVSAFFACVRLISTVVACLPLELKSPDASGKLVVSPSSRISYMLSTAPNALMTAFEFWSMMVASIILWGNAYAVKVTVAGRVSALNPLRPEYVTVYRNANGAIRYAYAYGTTRQDYSSDEILHIKGFGLDGLSGMSLLSQARDTLGRTIATERASGGIFQNGLSASGYIQYDQSLKPEQRDAVRKTIADFSGSSATGKTMVLENGMKYQGININPKDAQMLESRGFNVEDVCRWCGTPPQLIGHTSKASSWASSLENTILWFVKTGLRPYLTMIEQAVFRSLALPSTSTLRFNLEDLERGDSAARAALDASRAQNGTRTRNELRIADGLAPVDDPNANQLTVQSNLVPLAQLGQTPPAPTPPSPGGTP